MKRLLLLSIFNTIIIHAYSQFNSYVPQVPVDAYKQVLTAKQKEYNENKKRIHEAVNDAAYYLKELHALNDSVYKEFATPFNNYIDYLNTNRIDLAEYGDKIVADIRKYTVSVKQAIKNEYLR